MSSRPTHFTIGQLAGTAGVPISTVRFYERRGLLKPDSRTASNYRTYTHATADRLKFIRAARSSGFSLKDIREMLGLTHSDAPPCEEVTTLIERRLGDVREKLRELKRVERALAVSLKSCCRSEPDWCNAIERLKGRTSCDCPTAARPRKIGKSLLTLH